MASRIPDLTRHDLGRPALAAALEGVGRPAPEGIELNASYGPDALGPVEHLGGFPGFAPYVRGPYTTMYASQALDRAPVRRVLNRRGEQRLLPTQPRGRVRRACPIAFDLPTHRGYDSDHPRVMGTWAWRASQSTASKTCPHPVRRHPARSDERLDDHERRRAARPRDVHRRRRGAGREARTALGHHPERHPQGVHGPEHLHLPARPEHEDHRRHLPVHGRAHAALQQHLDQRLPHAGGRGDGRSRARLHPRRRRGVPPHGHRGRPGRRRLRAPPLVLLRDRHGLLDGGREAARRAPALARARQPVRAEEPEVQHVAHALPDQRLEPDRAGPWNNVARTAIEAMAATQGGTQSLHTNAFDEALALPTDFSARIARNTQLLLELETDTCAIVDPWGGSWFVERLTHDLADPRPGPPRRDRGPGRHGEGHRQGTPKLRIEEAAARTQAASTPASRW
jgi:hypothetical protein